MSIHRIFLGVAVLVIVFAAVSETHAQRTGTTGSTGSLGNSGNTGNAGNTRSQGGGAGGGAGGVATGTYVQDFSFENFSALSASTGNNRTGNNRTGNTGNNFIGSSGNTFIGSSGTGATGNRNTTGRTTNMTAGARNRANNANRTPGQTGGGGNAANNRSQIQPVITLGFTAPKADSAAVSTALLQRIENPSQTGRLGAVKIEFADGVAVVGGTVAGEHDRKVVENMLRLQPGVSEIKSDIQIVRPATPQNPLSPSAGRSQQIINVDGATTPQGRPLIHVF